MSTEVILVYLIIFLFFCVEFLLHYKFVNIIRDDLTEKQRSYIMSIKSAISMFLIGIYFNYHYLTSNFDQIEFFSNLESKGGMNFGKIIVLYFTAYLVMDLYIGHYDYRVHMDNLSGYFHHIVYCIVNMLSLYIGVYPIYFLHMMSELPTIILSLGSFDKNFRNDNLFGITFFLTRIVYHAFLIWAFKDNTLLFYIGSAALCLHVYWFYLWLTKYLLTSKTKNKMKNKKKNK